VCQQQQSCVTECQYHQYWNWAQVCHQQHSCETHYVTSTVILIGTQCVTIIILVSGTHCVTSTSLVSGTRFHHTSDHCHYSSLVGGTHCATIPVL